MGDRRTGRPKEGEAKCTGSKECTEESAVSAHDRSRKPSVVQGKYRKQIGSHRKSSGHPTWAGQKAATVSGPHAGVKEGQVPGWRLQGDRDVGNAD